VDVEDDGLSVGQWLALVARAHWILVATLAAHAILLLFVPGVWSTLVEAHSRTGRSWRIPLGERDLWLSGVGLVMYVLAGVGRPYHWAMRPPSDGEVTLARWLVRAAGLAILVVAFAITIP
jgi:hypothetical protein